MSLAFVFRCGGPPRFESTRTARRVRNRESGKLGVAWLAVLLLFAALLVLVVPSFVVCYGAFFGIAQLYADLPDVVYTSVLLFEATSFLQRFLPRWLRPLLHDAQIRKLNVRKYAMPRLRGVPGGARSRLFLRRRARILRHRRRSHWSLNSPRLRKVISMLLVIGNVERNPGPLCPGSCGYCILTGELVCATCYQAAHRGAQRTLRIRLRGSPSANTPMPHEQQFRTLVDARPHELIICGSDQRGWIGRVVGRSGDSFSLEWFAQMDSPDGRFVSVNLQSTFPSNRVSFMDVVDTEGLARHDSSGPPLRQNCRFQQASARDPIVLGVESSRPDSLAQSAVPTFIQPQLVLGVEQSIASNALDSSRINPSQIQAGRRPFVLGVEPLPTSAPHVAQQIEVVNEVTRAQQRSTFLNSIRAQQTTTVIVNVPSENEPDLYEEMRREMAASGEPPLDVGAPPVGVAPQRPPLRSDQTGNGSTHSRFLVPFLASAVEKPLRDRTAELKRQDWISKYGDTWNYAALAAKFILAENEVKLAFSPAYLSAPQQDRCWALIEHLPEVQELLLAISRDRVDSIQHVEASHQCHSVPPPRPQQGCAVQTRQQRGAHDASTAQLPLVADQSQRASRSAVRHFRPGERKCPVEGCGYAPQSRTGPALVAHTNTRHPRDVRERCSTEALAAAGLYVCSVCGEAVCDSNAGRGAHAAKCGEFRPRAQGIREQRNEFVRRPREQQQPQQSLVPEVEPEMHADVGSSFWCSRPSTHRMRESRTAQEKWANTVLASCLRGFSAAAPAARQERLRELLFSVRRRLTKRSAGHSFSAQSHQSSELRKANRVDMLVRIGAVGKALQTAAATGRIVEPVPEVFNRLVDLHPQAQRECRRLRQWDAPIGITEEVVANAVDRLSRGSAPGLDGWTRELLLPIARNPEGLVELTAVVADIVAGRFEEELGDMLNAGVLLALQPDLDDPKIRPIGMESAIPKLAGHAALLCLPPDALQSVFSKHQHGVGGSTENCLREIRRHFEFTPDLVALDMRNAYNSLFREAIVDGMESFPVLGRLFALTNLVLSPARLVVPWGGSVLGEIVATCGLKQGGVLSPLLFAVAIQNHLAAVAVEYQVEIEAYLDDITIIGDQAVLAARALMERLALIGLSTNTEKSFRLCTPERAVALPSAFRTITEGSAKILGAAVSLPDASLVSKSVIVDSKIDKMNERFSAVFSSSLYSCWARFHMMRLCSSGRVTYLTRTHEPEVTAGGLARFDQWTCDAMGTLIGSKVERGSGFATLMSLPQRRGGLGIRLMEPIAEVAHSAFLSGVKGEQRRLTDLLDEESLAQLQPSLSQQEVALVTTFTGTSILPARIKVSDGAVRVRLRERLLMQVRPGVVNADVHGSHNLVGNPRMDRHDEVVAAVAAVARDEGWFVDVEPKKMVSTNRSRPDILFVRAGVRLATDVTCVWEGSVRHRGGAIERAATAKHETWSASMSGKGYEFVSFACGESGRFGVAALELLSRLLAPSNRRRAMERCQAAIAEGVLGLYDAAQ